MKNQLSHASNLPSRIQNHKMSHIIFVSYHFYCLSFGICSSRFRWPLSELYHQPFLLNLFDLFCDDAVSDSDFSFNLEKKTVLNQLNILGSNYSPTFPPTAFLPS